MRILSCAMIFENIEILFIMVKTDFHIRFLGCLSIKNSARFPWALIISFLIFGIPQMVHGDIQYWDNTAPVGTWHTPFWSGTVVGGGALSVWVDGNSAVFSTTNAA